MLLRRLHPDPREIEATTLFDDEDLREHAPDGRPYVVVNMVASVDGRATLAGVTEQLSGPADKAVFFELRSAVDAVMVGTGTLRAERYGRLVRREERRAQRVARGLEAEPIALVCSRSDDVPRDIPLFEDPESRPVVYTGDDAAPASALRRVHDEHGVRAVLCEGGPRLNAGLLAAGVVDELFLTVTPLLAATPDPLTIVQDAGLGAPVGLSLVWVLEADGMLFLRYRLSPLPPRASTAS